MNSRGAACLGLGLMLFAMAGAPAASPTAARPVTATPPLQAIPATPGSQNVQQRMRGCNAVADSRKLQSSARETFIKTCMAPKHGGTASHPGIQTKPNA